MVTVPVDMPVTAPAADTVAIAGVPELHVTPRPVNTTPFASLGIAVSIVVVPITTVGVGGDTVMVLTGACVTVTVAEPLLVSLVAVIVAVPIATPVTTPLEETVAAAALLEVHVTTRSVTTVPFTSFTTTLRPAVVVAGTLIDGGDTATLPTGIVVTVTEAVPDLPSLVAVIVAIPEPTPVTTPLDDTVAIALLLVVQATDRPVRTAPLWSRNVAASVVVCPASTVAVGGVTVTVATGLGCTVTVVVPVFPSLVAVIVALPSPTPLTSPALETLAMLGLLEVHVTGRSFAGAPFTSVSVAES